MSAGHIGVHHIKAEEKTRAAEIIREPKFKAALRRYTKEDNSHRIIFLAGSDNDGTTVFYDKDLPDKLRISGRGGRNALVEFRQFLWWHEAVEGILIRLYDFTYDKAHRFATAIERQHAEAGGYNWDSYQRALKPFIKADEDDSAKGTPKNLLTVAYRNSRWWPEIEAATRKENSHG